MEGFPATKIYPSLELQFLEYSGRFLALQKNYSRSKPISSKATLNVLMHGSWIIFPSKSQTIYISSYIEVSGYFLSASIELLFYQFHYLTLSRFYDTSANVLSLKRILLRHKLPGILMLQVHILFQSLSVS